MHIQIASVAKIVEEFKKEWKSQIDREEIEEICCQIGYKWRQRVLGPVETIFLFALQILHGNTAITHLRYFSESNFSVSAYCLARCRLPLELLEMLLERLSISWQKQTESNCLWNGLRTWFLDGSSFSMPDTEELRNHFYLPQLQQEGCGFPLAHVLALFDAATGAVRKVIPSPWYTNDLSQAWRMHPMLQQGDLVVGDTTFCSFAHFCMLLQRGVHALTRQHAGRKTPLLENATVESLNKNGITCRRGRITNIAEGFATWRKPNHEPRWMTYDQYLQTVLCRSLKVRIITYSLDVQGFRSKTITLATTLVDNQTYSAVELVELYGTRWNIELNFRHLKITMRMDILKCATLNGVLKELYMFCIIYNLIRVVMFEAAARQGVNADRISFIDAWRWLNNSTLGASFSTLIVVPLRPNRVQPRVKKRRPKHYDLMIKPRSILIKEMKNQYVTP